MTQKKQLLIIFVKNIVLGKVKTRLAKTIGNENAFNVYKKLVSITETATQDLLVDKYIYFSNEIINAKWVNDEKFVQIGENIGERMLNAFKNGFRKNYENIVLIGSDLPEISPKIINEAFNKLNQNDFVFGPAADGGYYLVGMNNKKQNYIFNNKPWSTDRLLSITLNEIKQNKNTYTLLKELNDIDTIEDLEKSVLANEFKHNYELPRRNK